MMERNFNIETSPTFSQISIKEEDMYADSSTNMSNEYEPPKKKKRVRAKLDHLTAEQKMERRKEKNRIAAQTARDRKRVTLEQLKKENKIKNAECALKDKEIERLRNLVNMLSSNSSVSIMKTPSSNAADSGIIEMNELTINNLPPNSKISAMNISEPQQEIKHEKSINCPPSPSSSSTSGAYSASTMPDRYLDSFVCGYELDEDQCVEDIIQLEKSVYSDQNNDSFGSAVSINVIQQRLQENHYQSLLLENSAGWTSIQLMLLILITKVHRLYSARINCCAINHSISNNLDQSYFNNGNLYDYINNNKCFDFCSTARRILSTKDVSKQKLIALEFANIYVHRDPNFRRAKIRKK